jgi:hypothetical protein
MEKKQKTITATKLCSHLESSSLTLALPTRSEVNPFKMLVYNTPACAMWLVRAVRCGISMQTSSGHTVVTLEH